MGYLCNDKLFSVMFFCLKLRFTINVNGKKDEFSSNLTISCISSSARMSILIDFNTTVYLVFIEIDIHLIILNYV